jgi:ATP-dependent protease ClpP protease subunit
MSDGSWGRTRVELSSSASADASRSRDIGSHRLKEDVNSDSVFKLCDEIDNMIEYLQYRRIRIEVDSSGGSLRAFDYFNTKLEQWRLKGVSVETLGLTTVMSAGALILSMGDVGKRKAFSSTTLLYHNGRIPMSAGTTLTREGARNLERLLADSDKRYINMLVLHTLKSTLISDRYRQLALIYRSHEYAAKLDPRDIESLERILGFVADSQRGLPPEELTQRNFLFALYEALLQQDVPISPLLAKTLLLIDEIVDEPADQS